MRYIKKIICIVLMLVMIAALFVGCNRNNNDRDRSEKPDLHQAMMEYQAKTKKRSVFDAEFKVTFFQKESGSVVGQSIAQKLTADRIQNDDKIYIEATFGTSFVSEGFMGYLSAMINVMDTIMKDEEVSVDGEFMRYLNAETEFRGLLGYDGLGNYNVKGDYIESGQVPDYEDEFGNPQWASIDELSIINLMHNFGIGGEFSIKDYLMFSTMIDLSPSEEWVRRDDADKFLSDEEEAYLYAITTYGAKLRSLILSIAGEAEENLDADEYAEELQLYAQIFPTVASWISVHDSKVDASVNKNGSLRSLSSSIRVDLNINLVELRDIILLLTDETPFNVGLAIGLMDTMLTSASGENGTWTIRFDLITEESFYYDENYIDLSNKDQDMFIPNSEDIEGRTEIRIESEQD